MCSGFEGVLLVVMERSLLFLGARRQECVTEGEMRGCEDARMRECKLEAEDENAIGQCGI